jgi:hypothetical protein
MKVKKSEDQNKETRKAAKKELEQSLTAKLIEAVKSLGHDAEKIGGDLLLVSKFVAKKISKNANKEVVQKAEEIAKDLKKAQPTNLSKATKGTGQKNAAKISADPKKVIVSKTIVPENGATLKKPSDDAVIENHAANDAEIAKPAGKNTKDKNVSASKPNKAARKVEKVLQKTVSQAKPLATSVKVDVSPFNEIINDETKVDPAEVKRTTPVVKTNKVTKAPVKKNKPSTGNNNGNVN